MPIYCLLAGALFAGPASACEHRLDELGDRGVKMGRAITAEQVERLNLVVMAQEGRTRVAPFGKDNEKWLAFKAKLRMGDRFVAFDAPPELAAQLGIRLDGHAIVRGKCVVGFLKSAVR